MLIDTSSTTTAPMLNGNASAILSGINGTPPPALVHFPKYNKSEFLTFVATDNMSSSSLQPE